MTSIASVAELTTMIGQFADKMSGGMKKSVRKHFREYLLGLMIPPEIRRKSISNISSLVSECDQSTMNRAFHGIDPLTLEKNYIAFLKSVIGGHSVNFIGDDTLLEHPGSKAMEAVGWFHDRKRGKSILAHQPVTSGLYDIDADEFYPFLIRLYRKSGDSGDEFKTKIEIMEEIFRIAEDNFNLAGKIVDSRYSSFKFLGRNFVTEMKSDRKASFQSLGKMTGKNRDLFFTMDEILESTFLMFERNSDILKDFPMYRTFRVYLSNGEPVNPVVLYNPKDKRKKFLVSDYLDGDDIIESWNRRWSIETFHNDAKDLGMGEYQVRDGEGPLIQAGITSIAYTLLSLMMKASKKLFGKVLTTIGQCSRAIKEVLILKKNYKWRLFSG
ncbi:MAG: transposase [Candidatus Thermoplasmatota archaeon]|nr:transposase [Candidatus Thermoplasmatota archaeon]MDA8142358.1 transposase [Thermoplasmatales archaeon]